MSLQMTCPFCHREFPYNNGKLDADISKIGQQIHEINIEMAQIKALPLHLRKQKEGRRKVLGIKMAELQKKSAELRAVRKACDQQIKAFEYQEFKNIVKERYGESEYKKILEMVEQSLQAYKASGLMRHEYTRSPHKSNVTSVSKL